MNSTFPAVTATASHIPAESQGEARIIRRESAPIKGSGGDTFTVHFLHEVSSRVEMTVTKPTMQDALHIAHRLTESFASNWLSAYVIGPFFFAICRKGKWIPVAKPIAANETHA